MNPQGVYELPTLARGQIPSASLQKELTDALESGAVVSLASLDFPLSKSESALLDPRVLANAMSVSYTPTTDKLKGTSCFGAEAQLMRQVMSRFSRTARELAGTLFPTYKGELQVMRTSLRPAEIAGSKSLPRDDDTRLHVDAFPTHPTQGSRILRVFCNLNPAGKPRVWRLGEPFEEVARLFLPGIGRPVPGSAPLMHLLRLTKAEQTEYDFIMLKLHDAMKADEAYQHATVQPQVSFQPGTTWVCLTDSVSYAVISGQHQLDQTLQFPISAMRDLNKSPLRILERMRKHDLT